LCILVVSTAPVAKKEDQLELSRLEFENSALRMHDNAKDHYISEVLAMWNELAEVYSHVSLYLFSSYLFKYFCFLQTITIKQKFHSSGNTFF